MTNQGLKTREMQDEETCRKIRACAGRLNIAALQLEDDGRRYSTAAMLREVSKRCAEMADKLMEDFK